MSLSDPLLKSVKYLVQEFHSVGQVINDASPYLEQLCTTVEQCFLKGIKTGEKTLAFLSGSMLVSKDPRLLQLKRYQTFSQIA